MAFENIPQEVIAAATKHAGKLVNELPYYAQETAQRLQIEDAEISIDGMKTRNITLEELAKYELVIAFAANPNQAVEGFNYRVDKAVAAYNDSHKKKSEQIPPHDAGEIEKSFKTAVAQFQHSLGEGQRIQAEFNSRDYRREQAEQQRNGFTGKNRGAVRD